MGGGVVSVLVGGRLGGWNGRVDVRSNQHERLCFSWARYGGGVDIISERLNFRTCFNHGIHQ